MSKGIIARLSEIEYLLEVTVHKLSEKEEWTEEQEQKLEAYSNAIEHIKDAINELDYAQTANIA